MGVSWEDARAYARWAGLRLPTEAEWEYACRAGTTTRFYTGDEGKDLDRAGWYDGNSGGRLHPVGEKAADAFGLYDMHGKVWEWVADDWYDAYTGAPTNGSAWVNSPRGTHREIRGGVWGGVAGDCRSAARNDRGPGVRSLILGFRLSRSVALVP